MNAVESRCEVGEQGCEGQLSGGQASYKDIVGAGVCFGTGQLHQRGSEPTADPVAHDGVPNLLSDGETKAGGRGIDDALLAAARCWAQLAFENERRRTGASAAADTLKLGSSLERVNRSSFRPAVLVHVVWVHAVLIQGNCRSPRFSPRARGSARCAVRKRRTDTALSREALTALGATASENANATRRLHALAEAVAALTHEAAWLIRTFHVRLRALTADAPVSLKARKICAYSCRVT